MTDSAMNASPIEQKNPSDEIDGPGGILRQIQTYAEENPVAVDFWIDNEFQAAAILTSMAASLKHVRKTTGTLAGADKDELQKFERIYRQKASSGEALHYFRTIDEAEALEIFGLRIRAHRLILQ